MKREEHFERLASHLGVALATHRLRGPTVRSFAVAMSAMGREFDPEFDRDRFVDAVVGAWSEISQLDENDGRVLGGGQAQATHDRFRKSIADLESENAALRGLLRELLQWAGRLSPEGSEVRDRAWAALEVKRDDARCRTCGSVCDSCEGAAS